MRRLWARLAELLRSVLTPPSVREIEHAPERVTENTPAPPPRSVEREDAERLRAFRERREAIERRNREMARLYTRERRVINGEGHR